MRSRPALARGGHPALTVHAVDGDGTTRAVADLPLDADDLTHPRARDPRHVLAHSAVSPGSPTAAVAL